VQNLVNAWISVFAEPLEAEQHRGLGNAYSQKARGLMVLIEDIFPRLFPAESTDDDNEERRYLEECIKLLSSFNTLE
jgi:hypothetical protein